MPRKTTSLTSKRAARRSGNGAVASVDLALAVATGERFFNALTQYITQTLHVDYACVVELEGLGDTTVRTLSLCARGKTVENLRYDLRQTPCEIAIREGRYLCASGVAERFPADENLRRLGIEGYGSIALKTQDGRVLGQLTVMHGKPLTDLAAVEATLEAFASRAVGELARQRAQNLRLLAENMTDGILISVEGRHVFANRAMEAMLGYPPGGLIGTTMKDVVHPRELAKVSGRLKSRLEGENVPRQYETVYLNKDGGVVPVEINASLTVWQGKRAGLVSVRDVREREAVQQRLHQLNRLLATIRQIDQLIVRAPDAESLLVESCRILVDQGEYRMVWVGMADFQTGEVRAVAHAGVEDGYLSGMRVRCDDSPLGRGPTGTAIRTGRRAIYNNLTAEPGFQPWREAADARGYRSSAAFPLRVRDQVIGAINVYAAETGAFGDEDADLLEELAADIGFALRSFEEGAERRRAEQALAQAHRSLETAHAQLDAIVSHAPALAIQGYDAEGRVAFWNPASQRLYGFKPEQVIGRRLGGLILSEPDAQDFEALIREVLTSNVPAPSREWVTQTADGEPLWILSSIFPIRFGAEKQVICMDVDITERKRAEAERQKLSGAVEQTADAVIITDREGRIEYVNPAFEDTTGYRRAEVLGLNPRVVQSGRHDQAFFRELWETILSGRVYRNVLINRKKDGTLYYEEKTITPLKDETGRVTHFVSTGKDITERMQTQERLQYLAYHDVLTELPNRVLFMDRLEHALTRAPRSHRRMSVLFLDLDRFKVINDTLGHDFGDRLLQVLATRLQACVRDGDTVARVSGDEFAILLEDLSSTDDVVIVARKILEAFARPFEVFERELFITTSIGISVHPGDGQDAVALLKNADTAMYRAKESGRNTYQFYSADMGAKAVELLTLETGLRRALERDELAIHYQPVVDMRSGRIVGAEALVRWRHPQLGMVMPSEFIPLLEETGMILPVGEWVMKRACEQMRAWRASTGRALRIAVNLSARQFNDPGLAETVLRLTDDYRIEPGMLEFEITESLLMQHAPTTIETLSRLSQHGCRFAIDDFGTGYSSLSYLKRFPIHVLKIDRSFVSDIPDDKDDSAIVSTIVTMAHSLKLEVVAEGVETDKQLAFLRACGCDVMQGYLFSRAVPPEEFERLIAQDRRLSS